MFHFPKNNLIPVQVKLKELHHMIWNRDKNKPSHESSYPIHSNFETCSTDCRTVSYRLFCSIMSLSIIKRFHSLPCIVSFCHPLPQ